MAIDELGVKHRVHGFRWKKWKKLSNPQTPKLFVRQYSDIFSVCPRLSQYHSPTFLEAPTPALKLLQVVLGPFSVGDTGAPSWDRK